MEQNLEERMRRAVKAFRKMQPMLTAYARAITGKKNLRVVLTSQGARTDGKDIYYRPPIALGDNLDHDRHHCDKRDPVTLVQLCNACGVREEVYVNIYHEIGHIAYDSFAKASPGDKLLALEKAVDEVGIKYRDKLRQRFGQSAEDQYMALVQIVNPYLQVLYNAVEDARVDGEMFKTRPGIRSMMAASNFQILRDGIYRADGSRLPWSAQPLNAQAALACMLRIDGYTGWEPYLDPDVVSHTGSPGVQALLDRLAAAKSASDTFRLAIPLMEELRKHGYFKKPEEIPQEQPPAPSAPGADDNSGNEQEKDDQSESTPAGDSSASPDAESGNDDQTPQDSSSSGGARGDDQENADDSDRSESGDDDGAGSSGTGASDEAEGQSSKSDESSDSSGGDEETGVAVDDSSDDGGGSDSQESEPSSDGDETDGDESPSQEEGSESLDDSVDSGSQDASSDEQELGDDAPEEADDGDNDGQGAESSDDRAGDSSSGQEDGTDSVTESGEESGGDSSEQMDGSTGGDEEDGDGSSSGAEYNDYEDFDDFDDIDYGDDDFDDIDDDYYGDDDFGDGNEYDRPPAPDHKHGVDGEPCECKYCNDYGTLSDVEALVGHSHKELAPPQDDMRSRDETEYTAFIEQSEHFDGRSTYVSGVKLHSYPDENFFNYYEADEEVPESFIGGALLHTRRVFGDNAKASAQRNLRSGRVDTGVLGKRAWQHDDRLFHKRKQPGRRDYSVLIGIDLSSSTKGIRCHEIRQAALAQAELCHRVGVRFAVYGHSSNLYAWDTGDRFHALDIVVIKGFDQPWSSEAKSNMKRVRPGGSNLDGHTLEYYRKRLDEERTTDRIIMYYTDGAMPYLNFEEELEILQKELKTCKQRGYVVMGVGVGTDSPREHGLDTVEINSPDEVKLVVKHLEKRLTA